MTNPFSAPDRGDDALRRRPPDYSSRTVKMRLFMLVASIVLVVMIADRVREPAFWQMLGFEDRPIAGGPPLTDAEIAQADVDTHLPIAAADRAAPDQIGVIDARPRSANLAAPPTVDSNEPPERWGVAMSDSPAELVAASRDAWHSCLGELDGDQQLLFFRALARLRDHQRLEPAHAADWDQVITQLGTAWRAYAVRAADSLSGLPEDEQTAWKAKLAELARRWPEFWRPLLSQWVGDEGAPADLDLVLLQRLETHLDHVAAAAIRDNTMSRIAEKGIWFRWFEKLRDADPEQLRSASAGPTGYLPLFKQSADYRGKLVTVRGTVHQAYRVPAPKNLLGIQNYYVFWLRPAGGPNSPIVVYCLETPPGFPKLKDKLADGGVTELHEEVEFTGYFFKRWAYQAAEDILVAPLVLAQAPRWTPPTAVAPIGPTWFALAGVVAVAAVIGVSLVFVSLRFLPATRPSRRAADLPFELTEPTPGVGRQTATDDSPVQARPDSPDSRRDTAS